MPIEGLLEFLRAHAALIPPVLFLVALGEAVIFTSPLVPATVLCIGIGAAHQAAGGAFAPLVIAAALGTFIGDVASYALGRAYRDDIATWRPFRNRPTLLPSAIGFIQKWGILGLVGSKFLGPLRWFGPTVCGILQMRSRSFLIVTAVASVLWSLVVLGPAYYGVKAATG